MKMNADTLLISRRWGWSLAIPLVLVGASVRGQEVSSAPPSYEKEVLPILSEHCFQCHGPDEAERKAGLRLDGFEWATHVLKSGDAAIVPGEVEASSLVARVRSTDPDDRMPPPETGEGLTDDQIGILVRWIEGGAPYSVHWAYRPLSAGPVPRVSEDHLARNPIDAYVLAELKSRGIPPAPEATRHELIKRLSYDLLGLLPTPDEVSEFVADDAPMAYERLVDRLLDSEHFGERWGRHWLDKARYADSDGYEKDNPRPNAWKYRDWVINAVNDDMPFDQFTIEQLAGDLLPKATDSQHLATAFHRQTLTNTEGGTNREQWRVAAVMDRTETTGSVWMGLTVGCARCHTHKYDPISHHEYYQLYAYFNNGDETTTQIAKSQSGVGDYRQAKRAYDQKWQAKEREIATRVKQLVSGQGAWEQTLRSRLVLGDAVSFSNDVKVALLTPDGERDKKQKEAVTALYHQSDPILVSLRKEADALKKTEPASPYLKIRVISQRHKEPRRTHVLECGEFTKPLDEVFPGVLGVLPGIVPREAGTVGDRLDFARWLVSLENPLTPRVIANHIWSNLFGAGLVATRNDFGVRGERPSHPALLDHLATELQGRQWSRKELIRYIVQSATYRQSSKHRPELMAEDPKNRLLARQNRFRVEAEIIRDLYLDAAGLLSRKVGGPSVFPPTSKDVVALTYNSSVQWKVSGGEDRYRRGLYTFFKRTAPHPNLMTFDCPDSNTTCLERNRSNTPLAALTTLNNEVFVDAAKGFALRVLEESAESDRDRMRWAFLAAAVREPGEPELGTLLSLLESSRAYYQANQTDAQRLLKGKLPSKRDASEVAAWMNCVRVILNLDEVITRG